MELTPFSASPICERQLTMADHYLKEAGKRILTGRFETQIFIQLNSDPWEGRGVNKITFK